MNPLRALVLAVVVGFGPVTLVAAADFVDLPVIRWAWDEPLLDPAEEGVEEGVRQAVFGDHAPWFTCAPVDPVPTVNLVGPPAHGSFTRPGARQTLYQYVYDLCNDASWTRYQRRLAIVEDGEVVWVAEDGYAYYSEGMSRLAVVDLDGDGIAELVRWYGGNHHGRATIAAFTDEGVRTIAWFDTFADDCDGDPSWGGVAWSATPKVRAVDAGWSEFALEFVLHECHVYVEPGPDGDDALAEALALATTDPTASAMAVLALAWDGDPAGQREAARLFEEGTVLPRDPELAAWWRGRAEAGAVERGPGTERP